MGTGGAATGVSPPAPPGAVEGVGDPAGTVARASELSASELSRRTEDGPPRVPEVPGKAMTWGTAGAARVSGTPKVTSLEEELTR